MAISATLTAYNPPYGLDQTQTRRILRGLLVWAAGTYATGGILPSYVGIKQQNGEIVPLDTINVAPDSMWIQTISGSGYTYDYVKSTGKIVILVTGSASGNPQQELAAGALPAGVVNDVIEFEASWARA